MKSRKKMTFELLAKGVTKELIEQVMNELEEENKIGNEEVLIRRIMEKRHYHIQEMDFKEKRKMTVYLLNKGFTMEQIRRVIGESCEEYLT